MLDLEFVEENLEYVKEALARRGFVGDIKEMMRLNKERKRMVKEVEDLKHERNITSSMIGDLILKGQDVTTFIDKMRNVNQKMKIIEDKLKFFNDKVLELLLLVPNIPHESVPIGKDKKDNVVVRQVGDPPKFDFPPKDHITIGKNLRIIDLSISAKITGSKFPFLIREGALLERALINFMLDLHVTKHGYIEVLPPFLVSRESMRNTGQLPKFKEDLFSCQDDLYLIPTAEVPLTNIHKDEILSESDFPIYYTAYTPCFRREAGSWGKEAKGLIRQHQFDKVELVKFTLPEESYNELEKLVQEVEDVLKELELPYRVVNLCTGELGFAAAKSYDLEVWMPSLGEYVEISSCSNCVDFQARRANIKFRRKSGQKEYVHTLNGSGLAVGRTVAAILENFQQKDGSVVIPPALVKYMHGIKILKNPH